MQIICAILESCGRFLHRQRDCTARCEAMLELIIKMRSVSRLPLDLLTNLENAVHACKPPEVVAVVVEERVPLHRYVMWLLHNFLNKNTVGGAVPGVD